MSARICRFSLQIMTNGQTKNYTLSPLAAGELGPGFAAGFKLTNRSESPPPVYLVRVRESGALHCSCPAFAWDERKGHEAGSPPDQPDAACIHTEALLAAGAIVRSLVDTLKARTKLLDSAELRIKQLEQHRKMETQAACRNADSLRQSIARLESELHLVSQRALKLQAAVDAQVSTSKPRRSRSKKLAA